MMIATDLFRLAHRVMALEGGWRKRLSAVILRRPWQRSRGTCPAEGDRLVLLALTDSMPWCR